MGLHRRKARVSQFYAVHQAADLQDDPPPSHQKGQQLTLRQLCRAAGQMLHQLSARVYSTLLRLLCAVRLVEDLDAINECIDCGAPFSLWRWRRCCAGCANGFCDGCLDKRHIVDTVHLGNETAPRVCSFCFFTHCAKFCGATCCGSLPVREVKRFLSRKGISMVGAVEKRDLIDSIQNWALELANATDFVLGDDIEFLSDPSYDPAVLAVCDKDTGCGVQHNPFEDLRFQVSELRQRLQVLGHEYSSGIVEKEELVQQLLRSH